MTRLQNCTTFPQTPILLFAIGVTCLVLNAPAYAGVIDAWTWSPDGIASVALTGTPILDPNNVNNDNIPGQSPNRLTVTQKDYQKIGPVDIVISVIDSGGVTEYTIEEGVSNSTGVDWSSYRMILGFGIGSSFVMSSAGDGLDFDALDYDSPPDFSGGGFFADYTWGEDELVVFDGLFPNTGFSWPLWTFNIDVPDGITSFTLRQQPTAVPEPGSILLVTLASAAFLSRRRRRS